MLRQRHLIGLILFALFSSVAYASGDFGCGLARGSILFRSYQSCNSVPFLSPGNDSRLNLELLLIDAGKLAGSVNLARYYPTTRGLEELLVPFDLENWDVHQPVANSPTNAAAANAGRASDDYAQGEGSRCKSDGAGIAAFTAAVNSSSALPKDEASILITARSELVADCNSTKTADWKSPEGIQSTLGSEFVAYIAGASAFYAGDYSTALSSFNGIKNSGNPWLRETSRYMVGRTLLNSAQAKAFGEYGDLKLENLDKGSLKGAEDAFDAYLRDFPHGTYSASARGLLRRVYWLGNDNARLAEAFDRALEDADKGANNVTALDLVQEADAKLLDSGTVDQIRSPQFLAILDLMKMRSGSASETDAGSRSSFALAELEGQKDRFASNPALYNYLLATYHVYVDDKPEQALALLPNLSGTRLSYFAFSQQTLRALAMDASHQFDAERRLLVQMMPIAALPDQSEQLQLELALLEVHTGHADRIFAPGSLVRDQAIRAIVIEHTASAEMLRQRIKDPKESADAVDAAVYTLLYKELTGGKYQAFQADLSLVPQHPSEFLAPFVAAAEDKGTSYRCPALREVAARLQRDANDARGLNCVGELVRLHDVHFGQDAEPPKSDLGGSNSLFPGTKFSRLDNYLKVIANKQAETDSRAYALARAVRCYEPSGYNECGDQKIPISTRKQWFEILHKEYADSVWAKSLKYYW
jgi:TolA-binding protein